MPVRDENGRRAARRDAAHRSTGSRRCRRFGLLATPLASIGLYGVMAFVARGVGRSWASGLPARRGGVVSSGWSMSEVLSTGDRAGVGIPAAIASRPSGVVAALGIQPRSVDRGLDDGAAHAGIDGGRLILAHRASRIDPILAFTSRVTASVVAAGRGDAPHRARLHLAVDQRPSHADASSDLDRSFQRLSRRRRSPPIPSSERRASSCAIAARRCPTCPSAGSRRRRARGSR